MPSASKAEVEAVLGIVFHYLLGGMGKVGYVFGVGGGFWFGVFCIFFFPHKMKGKLLLFRVLFSRNGKQFSVLLLRYEHIAKKYIVENKSLASHTSEMTT